MSPDDLVHQDNTEVSSDVVEHNFERRNFLSMSLAKLYFHAEVIQFNNVFMYNYYINILIDKVKENNVSSSNKWQVSNTMLLYHIFI